MDLARTALVVVDVQRAFDDLEYWSPTGRRDNPACEENVGALIAAWRADGRPLVYVRHDSDEPGSPLAPGTPGNAFRDVVTGEPDLLVTKRVNSAFYGSPDLHAWLQDRGIGSIRDPHLRPRRPRRVADARGGARPRDGDEPARRVRHGGVDGRRAGRVDAAGRSAVGPPAFNPTLKSGSRWTVGSGRVDGAMRGQVDPCG